MNRWEGKYELDSIVYVIRLSLEYYKHSGDSSIFFDDTWQKAMQLIVTTIAIQQKSTWEDVPPAYYFRRPGEMVVPKPAARTGMSKSFFRPSDDYSDYLFPIAANAMAVVELKKLAHVWRSVLKREDQAAACEAVAHDINVGIVRFGIAKDKAGQPVFAYEVDGLGNQTRMDDANVPSLLSLPYLGYVPKDDSMYTRTRQLLLSSENPFYYVGTAAKGIGSPHTYPGWIWPISLVQQALTSNNDQEISECLEYIKAAGKVSYFMHESFNKDDPSQFTRSWFAWANSLYGELILTLAREKPHLIFN
jgi:meiotically up-regulated gene 157 (Mug157) protein